MVDPHWVPTLPNRKDINLIFGEWWGKLQHAIQAVDDIMTHGCMEFSDNKNQHMFVENRALFLWIVLCCFRRNGSWCRVFFLKASHFDYVAMNLQIGYSPKSCYYQHISLLCTAVVVEMFAFLEAVLLRARRELAARRAAGGKPSCWLEIGAPQQLNAGGHFRKAWGLSKKKSYPKLGFSWFSVFLFLFSWCLWNCVEVFFYMFFLSTSIAEATNTVCATKLLPLLKERHK